MAYGQSGTGSRPQGNYSKPATAGAPRVAGKKFEDKPAILFTGAFAPDETRDGDRLLASVTIKDSLTIPAGSKLKVMTVDPSKYANGKKVPAYLIVINEGKVTKN